MKKILIISDSDVGKQFIQRAIDTYSSENIYYIVEQKANEYKGASPARFKFFEFDPTSLYKLANLLKMEFIQLFIALESKTDTLYTIKNIRAVKDKLQIVVVNRWNLVNEDPHTIFLNTHEILASRLLDYLPNVPVIAQNVGKGEGEIMEVLVPFGSSFVYRHIGVIEQKNWRIVAIYRNQKLVMPSRRRMIQPNDLLLLIGEPSVLKSVYRAIKQELGQFPEPFGSNLYLYIDMKIMRSSNIKAVVENAIYVYQHFKHKLIIKIVNPSDIDLIQYIKEYRNSDIIIDIEYESRDLIDKFYKDIKSFHVGLVIVSRELFADYKMRKVLYNSHVPVFKLSMKKFSSVKDVALVLSDNRDLEKVSTTIFDISQQMSLNIELYNYEGEHQENINSVIENYNNLATIFSKSIKIHKSLENPIRLLKHKENFIQVIPFTSKLTARRFYSLFSIDSEKLYYKLDEHHQIFIPVQL